MIAWVHPGTEEAGASLKTLWILAEEVEIEARSMAF